VGPAPPGRTRRGPGRGDPPVPARPEPGRPPVAGAAGA
jgi:hypothetical protein